MSMTPILTSFELNLATSLVMLAGTAILAFAALNGWREWIALKRDELARLHGPAGPETGAPTAASRIELADLKERLRKLEAIAAGVDL
jgi:hypothetical protein